MVKKVLNSVYKEVRGLHQAAYILALFTFGSQILALIRDRILAHQFGAGPELDLYYTAFRIPDMLYVLFASTLSVYVLIPFITKSSENEGDAGAQRFLSQFFSLFVVVYSGIALLAMVCAPFLVSLMFPGFAESSETLILLLRILLVQPLLLGVSSLYGVVTQLEYRFMLYAVSPLIYNVGIITGALLLYPFFGISGLALGVLLGALGHVCIQIPYVRRSAIAPRFTTTIRWGEIVLVCRMSLTRALTLSLHQLVLLAFIGGASMMAVGSVSVFQFAYNLQSVPLAIIGVSYSVAAFPLLAQLYAEGKYDVFREQVTNALRHIFFWGFLSAVLFIVIRAQFVRVVLGSGAFDWDDTKLTAAVLALFMLSLVSQAVHLLIVRSFYAIGNTRVPFFVTLASSLLALASALSFDVLIRTSDTVAANLAALMRLSGVTGVEVLALPLGYSGALILHSFIILFFGHIHRIVNIRTLIVPALQSLVAAIVCGVVAYGVLGYGARILTTDTVLGVFAQGCIAGISGIMAYAFVQYLVRNRELHEVWCTLRKKFTKGEVIMPQDEDTLAV